MKKLTIITTRPFFPANGGDKVRVEGFYNHFKQNLNLDITVIVQFKSKKDFILFKKKIGPYIEVIGIHFSIFKALLNIIIGYFKSFTPLQILMFDQKNKQVIETLKKSDIIYSHLIRNHNILKGYEYKTILDATDSLSFSYSSLKKNIFSIKYWFFKIDQKRIFEFEKKAHEYYNKIIFISENDVNFLYKKSRPKNIKIIKNGVKKPAQIVQKFKNKKSILFIGNLNSIPNQNAVKFVMKNILPFLDKEIYFTIAGNKASDLKIPSNLKNRIKCIKNYNDPSIFQNSCFCGIAPMMEGAGLQNKILDYLNIGLTALSSELGNNGFTEYLNSPIIICKNDKQFINKINQLFKMSEKESRTLHNLNRSFIVKYFSWDKQFVNLNLFDKTTNWS